jgi:hypothetical protein
MSDSAENEAGAEGAAEDGDGEESIDDADEAREDELDEAELEAAIAAATDGPGGPEALAADVDIEALDEENGAEDMEVEESKDGEVAPDALLDDDAELLDVEDDAAGGAGAEGETGVGAGEGSLAFHDESSSATAHAAYADGATTDGNHDAAPFLPASSAAQLTPAPAPAPAPALGPALASGTESEGTLHPGRLFWRVEILWPDAQGSATVPLRDEEDESSSSRSLPVFGSASLPGCAGRSLSITLPTVFDETPVADILRPILARADRRKDDSDPYMPVKGLLAPYTADSGPTSMSPRVRVYLRHPYAQAGRAVYLPVALAQAKSSSDPSSDLGSAGATGAVVASSQSADALPTSTTLRSLLAGRTVLEFPTLVVALAPEAEDKGAEGGEGDPRFPAWVPDARSLRGPSLAPEWSPRGRRGNGAAWGGGRGGGSRGGGGTRGRGYGSGYGGNARGRGGAGGRGRGRGGTGSFAPRRGSDRGGYRGGRGGGAGHPRGGYAGR